MIAVLTKPTFEESFDEIDRIVSHRQSSWTYLSILEWNDVKQIVLMRIFSKWETYDPAKSSKQNPERALEKWVNTVVTRALHNLRRDHLIRYSRPCIGGGRSNGVPCQYNGGSDSCTSPWVKSRTQCSECPLYADWLKTKSFQLNIKSTVALENHVQEVSSKSEELCDIEGIKTIIDQQMKVNLTQWEYRIYECLYIRHMSPIATGAALEAVTKTWKRAPREDECFDYQFILGKQRWYRELMFEILKREGYDLEAFLTYEHR